MKKLLPILMTLFVFVSVSGFAYADTATTTVMADPENDGYYYETIIEKEDTIRRRISSCRLISLQLMYQHCSSAHRNQSIDVVQ